MDGGWVVEGERMNIYIYFDIYILFIYFSLFFLLFSRSAGSA